MFWNLWNQARKDYACEELVGGLVQKVHLQVALETRKLKRYEGSGVRPPEPEPEHVPLTTPLAVEDCFKAQVQRPFVITLLSWLRLATDSTAVADNRPGWYSFLQLYVGFVNMTGMRPPFCREVAKSWYSPQADRILNLREIPLKKRVTWFQGQVRDVLVAAGAQFQVRPTRPAFQR